MPARQAEEGLSLGTEDLGQDQSPLSVLELSQLSRERSGDMITWVDVDGRLLYSNDSCCRRYGYTREEFLGMTIFDLDPSHSEEDWQVHWQEVKSRGTMTFEVIHQARDGERFSVEITANYVEHEGEEYHIALARDVSERNKVEESLRLAQLSIDRASDLIVWITPDGYIGEANESACRRLGYSREELLKMTIFGLDPGMQEDQWPGHWEELKRRRSLTFESQYRTHKGELFPGEVTANYIDLGGKEYVFGFIRDISERKRMEEYLRLTQFSVDHAADMMAWVSPEGRFLFANDTICRRTGYMREELLQLSIYDLDPTAQRPWEEHWQELKSRGSLTFETIHRTKAGEIIQVEVTANYIEYEGREYDVSSARDITERKKAEEALKGSEGRYRTLVENAHDLIFALDRDGRLTAVNAAFERATGYTRAEVLGTSLADLAGEGGLNALKRVDSARDDFGQREIRLSAKAGQAIELEVSVRPVFRGGELLGYECIARDVTESRAWEEALKFQALHDPVTSLPNRMRFLARIQELIILSKRHAGPFAICVLDLDNFKDINDSLGHESGEAVLRQAASRLQASVRPTDMVARLGGNEFALLMPARDEREAGRIALRTLAVFRSPFVVEEHELTVRASLGVALFPPHGKNGESLVRAAGIALDAAKRAGGSRYAIHEIGDCYHSANLPSLQAELRRALEHGGLELHYQPIVDLRRGKVVALEALVRWDHPRRGLIMPGEFIDLLQLDGLSDPLAHWVLRTALSQLAEWRFRGFEVGVSVNLSARNLDDPDLPALIENLLGEHGVDPGWLTVELTESSVMVDPERSIAALSSIRASGVSVAIDDFGSGQSTLSYLRRLPADEVKIDKSFVLAMTVDKRDAAIVRSTIALAHDLGLRVVGEGVEDEATKRLLARYGCDLAQGYYLGRPVRACSASAQLVSAKRRDRLGHPVASDHGKDPGPRTHAQA